jgi:hypothetical protein
MENPAMTPNPARPEDEHARSVWPGFPFPPPMMGLAAPTVNAASSHWLLTVAAMLETGEMNLNTLFASAPAELALRRFELPERSLLVVTGAGMYALGAVTPSGPRTLPARFAAPAAVHRNRLIDASNLLAAGPQDQAAGRLDSPNCDTARGE